MKDYTYSRVLFTTQDVAVISNGYERECINIDKAFKMFEDQFNGKLEIVPKKHEPLEAYFFEAPNCWEEPFFSEKDRSSRAFNRKMRYKHHPVRHSKELKASNMGRDWRLCCHFERERNRKADFRRSMYPERIENDAIGTKSIPHILYTEENFEPSFEELFEYQEYLNEQNFKIF